MIRAVYENEPFPASAEEEERLRAALGGNVRREGRTLRIVRVAGQLRLSDGSTWVIRSHKADGASLLAWLAYADPTLDALAWLGMVPDLGDDMGFGNLVARVFCLETWRAVQTSGLLRAYHRQAVQSAVVRGRIDFARLSRGGGDLSRVPCVVFARLPQTPLNRLLAAAVQRVDRDPELRRAAGASLPQLAAHLAEVAPVVDASMVTGKTALSRLEQPFAASAALARVLLRHGGLGDGDGLRGPGFVVSLASLFERTVARAFADAGLRAVAKQPVRVARPGGSAWNGGDRRMEIDVLLPDVRGEPVVVDAKYKTKLSSANLQQMVTYCWVTGARRAVLVVPAGVVADRRRFEIAGPSGEVIRIDVAELELGARTLGGWRQAAEAVVATVVGGR